MRSKVRLKKGVLDRFRTLARNSPLEIQCYLIGEVVSSQLTVIDSFAYAPRYAIQKSSQVAWYVEDYEAVKKKAEERGRRIIGQIHSHPDWDAVLSPTDYEVNVQDGYRLMGIVSTHNGRTRARFWVMDCAVPCEIEYAKNP